MILDTLRGETSDFTVNTAVTDVVINPVNAFILQNQPGLQFFQPRDNVTIVSVAITLPLDFAGGQTNATGGLRLSLNGRDSAALQFGLPPLGTVENIYVHCENNESPVDIYIPFSVSPNGLKWGFYGQVNGRVSMVGVPAALNGQTFTIHTVLKVRHTLPMIV